MVKLSFFQRFLPRKRLKIIFRHMANIFAFGDVASGQRQRWVPYRIIPNKRAGRGDEVGGVFIMCTKMLICISQTHLTQGSKLDYIFICPMGQLAEKSTSPPKKYHLSFLIIVKQGHSSSRTSSLNLNTSGPISSPVAAAPSHDIGENSMHVQAPIHSRAATRRRHRYH